MLSAVAMVGAMKDLMGMGVVFAKRATLEWLASCVRRAGVFVTTNLFASACLLSFFVATVRLIT